MAVLLLRRFTIALPSPGQHHASVKRAIAAGCFSSIAGTFISAD